MHHDTGTAPPRQSWPRRHRLATGCLGFTGAAVLLIIVAAVIGGNATSGGGSSGASTPRAAPSPAGGSHHAVGGAHIGTPVRDGKFQFVITRITHRHSVGDTSLGLGSTAQGRFTVLHVKVTNISNQAQTLDDSAQFVFDQAGRKFDASPDADLQANPGNGGGVFFNDINPGNTVHGVILFDLPKGDKAVRAELHDSVLSGGAMVELRR